MNERLTPDQGQNVWARVHNPKEFRVRDEADPARRDGAEIVVHHADMEGLQTRRVGRQIEGVDLPVALRAHGVALKEAAEHDDGVGGAFALDQQMSSARARRELPWTPQHLDALTDLAAEGS